jgi:hypothetical protein
MDRQHLEERTVSPTRQKFAGPHDPYTPIPPTRVSGRPDENSFGERCYDEKLYKAKLNRMRRVGL